MLDGNNVVRKAGADPRDDGAGEASTEGVPPEPSTTDDDPTEDQIDKEIDDAFEEAQNAFIEEPPFIDPRSGGGTATVALSMTLDLSRYPAAEVITILRALGLAARG